MAEPVDHAGQMRLMAAVLDALKVDWRNRMVRRVTLVLDAEQLPTVYVEDYLSGEAAVDLATGIRNFPADHFVVVDGPPPAQRN